MEAAGTGTSDGIGRERAQAIILLATMTGFCLFSLATRPDQVLLKSAVGCWIPIEDLRDFLNRMPGPRLTTTDVAQRLRAFEEEGHSYLKERLRPSCLAVYEKEKADGTELPAII